MAFIIRISSNKYNYTNNQGITMNANEAIEALYRQHEQGRITKEEFEKRARTVQTVENFLQPLVSRTGSDRIKQSGTKR